MEYKICENCGAKLHSRTQKCPICNTILTDASQIINDTINDETNQNIGTNYNVEISDTTEEKLLNKENIDENNQTPSNDIQNSNEQKPNMKDYVYKAEVHHSLEYTEPLSNMLKVILTAIASTFPMMGQLIGIFFGIFFSTYEDRDRKSFGKALIILSIIMFMLYAYTLMSFSSILNSETFNNLLK